MFKFSINQTVEIVSRRYEFESQGLFGKIVECEAGHAGTINNENVYRIRTEDGIEYNYLESDLTAR